MSLPVDIMSKEDLSSVRNLLAVCNGDGGHRQIEVGMAQAAEEAEEYVNDLRQRVAELPSSLREALDEVKRLRKRLPTSSELNLVLGLAWSAEGLYEEDQVRLHSFRKKMEGS